MPRYSSYARTGARVSSRMGRRTTRGRKAIGRRRTTARAPVRRRFRYGRTNTSSSRSITGSNNFRSTAIINTVANVTTIKRREFVTTLTTPQLPDVGTTPFNAPTIDINPGNPNCFPWLSSVARNWCTYKFKKLHFQYITSSGSVTVNQALGTVGMAIDYNNLNPPLTSMGSRS